MHDFAEAWYAANPAVDEAGDEPGRLVPLLVMTSGNVHDEPICIADEEARAKLAGIADAFLGNNRPILTRFDDSVVRLIQVDEVDEKPVCAIQFLRRARGYAPVPVSVTAEGVAPAEDVYKRQATPSTSPSPSAAAPTLASSRRAPPSV